MKLFSSSLICAVALLSLFNFVQGVHEKTLVLVDDLSTQTTHSKFLQSLTERGYDVTVRLADSDDIEIKKYGEFLFDNLVLLCPKTEDFGGDLSEDLILEFVDAGKSLVVALSPDAKSPMRDLAAECGVTPDDAGTSVVDHLSYDVSDPDGTHSLIVSDTFGTSSILGDAGRKSSVLFRGVGLQVASSNPLATKLLSGTPTTYSAKPIDTSAAFTAGTETVLVAAVQTLGQGRVLVSGSIDLMSDSYFSATINKFVPGKEAANLGLAGNGKFIEEAMKWTLGERGVLRAHSLMHMKADGSEVMPRTYRVKDDLIFSIVVEEFDGSTNSWKPYTAEDVQVEFEMLDPYERRFLKPLGNGTFTLDMKVPDVYGVFKFVVDYRRDGFSHIVVQQEVGVRPFRHNEFERFILSAYPYYLSSFSMMAGFVVFSFLFLFTKDQ